LQNLDDLVAGEAAGGRFPNAKDMVTCAKTPVLIGREEEEHESQNIGEHLNIIRK